jgi:hypothetical protein
MENGELYGKLNSQSQASIFQLQMNSIHRNRNVFNHRASIGYTGLHLEATAARSRDDKTDSFLLRFWCNSPSLFSDLSKNGP